MRALEGGLALVVLMILVSALGLPDAGAQGASPDAGVRPGQVTEGALLWRAPGQGTLAPAPVLGTDVDMRVTGVVLRARVRQDFTNPSGEWAEGVYVFPLPEDAAVDHMRMRVADRTIEGVIQERAAAKKTYEAARRQGQRASLVEQERPNVFTTSVANIPPGASISVEIEYQQVLRFDQGRFGLRFPMVVGPRYIPGVPAPRTAFAPPDGLGWAEDTDQVPDASRITPPVRHPAAGPINPVSLRIELDVGVPLARLEAPYHRVETASLGDGRYSITLGEGAVPADRDFELVWEPAAGAMPEAAVFTEARGHDVFALLMVVPPAAASLAARRAPREVIFVIDTSGSMHGASIEQARAALRLALARLQPADTFNVIQFNSVTEALFPAAEAVTPASLYLAERYVGALKASGGTEMLPALTLALDRREHAGRLRQVIFLTDGAVGNEEQLFTLIRERLAESRLFTIGIGSAPNSHFMREAARLGRGTFTYVGSVAEVQQKMDALFRKLESPALTDVELELPGAVQAEMLPPRIPDLYLGEPVLVTVRAGALPARAVLRGRFGSAPWERELWLQDAAEGAGLSVHWARAKIAVLLDARRSGAPDEDVRSAVIEIALEHHLVSPYTSLVAVDVTPVRPAGEPVRTHPLETNLPHGWDAAAVSGLGQGATAGPVHVVLGLVAIVMAAALYALSRLPAVPVVAPVRRRAAAGLKRGGA